MNNGRKGLSVGCLACFAIFAVYYTFRQRYIWGTDSFGYDRLAVLFAEGKITLPTEFPAADYPALVPMGFSLNSELRVVPNYTPGYPLLLALGHLVGAAGLITPLLGALSCLFIYLLLVDRVSRSTAFTFALVWAFMPTAVYGGTMIMSDGASATVVLGALLAIRRKLPGIAGWLLILAIAIRPTNVLFFLPVALIVRWDRSLPRLIIHGGIAGMLYALYNWRLFGAPWKTGYGDLSGHLQAAVFRQHFQFYFTNSLAVLSPVIVGLAVLALGRRPGTRERIAYALWPAILIVFYSFWEPGGVDRWWWTRFLLPGYATMFLLAAEGFEGVIAGTLRWGAGKWTPCALFGLMALLPIYFVRYGLHQRDLWRRDIGTIHHAVVQKVAAIAPAGSIVGTTEHGSTFLLYTKLVPYISVHDGAPDLIAATLAKGRRAFLLVEPQNAENGVIRRTMQQFHAKEVARFPELWDGLPLYELTK